MTCKQLFRLGLIVSSFAMAVAGCVVENPNATEQDSDAGVSTIDGGVECDVSCSEADCPSGQVSVDEACRCVCEVVCNEVACEPCGSAQTPVSRPGECCPDCVDGCQNDSIVRRAGYVSTVSALPIAHSLTVLVAQTAT